LLANYNFWDLHIDFLVTETDLSKFSIS
jgi:hypothetical protein